MRSPAEITEFTTDLAVTKAGGRFSKLFILGILAGGFVAFGAESSNMAAFNLFLNPNTYGLGKVLAGTIFTTGLMAVLIAGAELFTGNILMIASVAERKIKLVRMLRNWGIVFAGNLVGSVLIAWMMAVSGLFNSGSSGLGAVTLKIAAYKVDLGFGQAFVLAIMCNWLVCLAVWMSFGSTNVPGKILAIFFPIWLFVTSGFEHSVANIYYITAGILIKNNEAYLEAAHLTPEALGNLTWEGFFVHNLLPVTLGNIVGGGVFVAMAYWYVYARQGAKAA